MLTGLVRGDCVDVLIDAVALHHVSGRFTPTSRLDLVLARGVSCPAVKESELTTAGFG